MRRPLAAPGARPLRRGTCRTGAAVALYRFERDGWTIDDVAAEMKRQTYRDGWLPGYVYAMVKRSPARTSTSPRSPSTTTALPRAMVHTPARRRRMSVDPVTATGRSCAFGPIGRSRDWIAPDSLAWIAFVALASGFVLVGGGNLDPGQIESRLGLAAGAGIGPFGQVFGGWEPSLWPAQVAPSVLWSWAEGGRPTTAALRWPSAIAGILIGLILTRRAASVLGPRAGVMVGVCLFGSVALIDRSAGAGIDLIAGLATVAALDRLLGRGSDLVAGAWTGLAFLAAGWPPLVLIVLATVVIGRPESSLSFRLLRPARGGRGLVGLGSERRARRGVGRGSGPPLDAEIGLVAGPRGRPAGPPLEPLRRLGRFEVGPRGLVGRRTGPRPRLAPDGRGVPAGRDVRPRPRPRRRVPALAGLAVVAAACCDRAWAGSVSTAARRVFLTLAVTSVVLWVALVMVGGTYLASAVSYYRGVSIVLMVLGLATAVAGWAAVRKREPKLALAAVIAVAVGLKIAHAGYYVPEWNYRHSQGPWGRAIGQWVPPRLPIYTIHTWPTDLAFATGRPIRQLPDPRALAFHLADHPQLVLLLDSEFEHWPEDAPPLIKVAAFRDQRGQGRVLARTEGDFSWRRMAGVARDE